MADRVPLIHENEDRVVRGIRGLSCMTQTCETTNLSRTPYTSRTSDGSSSGSEVAPSRAEDNKRLCRPEKGAWKDSCR